jgi:esterase/lipase
MGAWATIITTAQDDRVKGAVAIAGGSTSSEVPERIKVYLSNIITQKFLKGVDLEETIEDWVKMGQELAAQDWVEKISPRPLLLIGGSKDATVTPERVKTVYSNAKKPTELEIVEGADHVFTRHRKNLVEKVTRWLQSKL